MNKKILIFGLLAIVVASIGVASAEEIGGIDFDIPDGYSLSNTLGVSSDLTENIGTVNLYSNGDDIFSIAVIPLDSSKTTDDLKSVLDDGFDEKTINETDGLFKDMDDHVIFEYIKDNNQVSISAKDESMIESLMDD